MIVKYCSKILKLNILLKLSNNMPLQELNGNYKELHKNISSAILYSTQVVKKG